MKEEISQKKKVNELLNFCCEKPFVNLGLVSEWGVLGPPRKIIITSQKVASLKIVWMAVHGDNLSEGRILPFTPPVALP